MAARALEVLNRAQRDKSPWFGALGAAPHDGRRRELWVRYAVTVAAYRDRYGVDDVDDPLGPNPGESWTQRSDHHRAQVALRQAEELSQTAPRARQQGVTEEISRSAARTGIEL